MSMFGLKLIDISNMSLNQQEKLLNKPYDLINIRNTWTQFAMNFNHV